ncbi:ComEC/Rec2 family competence protein [Pseudoroseicyclus sp. CXY001]|uniref:ComEC/Rec2 family competence protein n=1 Tax=Pseudoroseicyclus sp. CXY001 TaxID=3242492 RepID=UPI003571708E
MRRWIQAGAGPATGWEAQRGHLLLWVPVCLGAGIGFYFALPVEPSRLGWAALALVGALLAGGAWLGRGRLGGALALALVLASLGAGLAGARVAAVAEPVLGFRYYGPVEGRVLEVDVSASEAPRLLLDQVVLRDMAPERIPARVRISLFGDMRWLAPEPGQRIMTTAHLSPPSAPAEPGGFDFRRHAWFERLGALGYTRAPALLSEEAEPGALPLARLRRALSLAVRDRIAGDAGGFAAAVTTGDRSGLSPGAAEALRGANLYHLVAISGMHMGLLTGFVFALVRGGLALIPALALRLSTKKLAALVALPAAAAYLALAGRAVPTERAFVMAAVALVAVLLDRRAISMRAVAIAALIVLVLRPESLVNAGFQMSFAAVVALVAVFGAMPLWGLARRGRLWRWAMPALLLGLSSLVAGLATAPIAAVHFNRMALYGLAANLLAVPAMGLLVMPGAVIAGLLAPLGLAAPGLLLMEFGARWILAVAARVSEAEGAVRAVVSPPAAVLPLLAFGGLVLALWRGRGRWAGLAPLGLALALWQGAPRPALLVSDTGGLLGLMTPDGRALSRERTDSYNAGIWLQNDGSLATQEEAAASGALAESAGQLRIALGGVEILQIRGTRALAALGPDCGGAAILIANVEVPGPRPCDVYDSLRLRGTGALALDPAGHGAAPIPFADPAAPEGITFDGGSAEVTALGEPGAGEEHPLAPLQLVTAAARAGLRPWTEVGPHPARPPWRLGPFIRQ